MKLIRQPWHLIVVRKKLEFVHDAFASRSGDVDILTPVVMYCWAQRVSMLIVGCPCLSYSRFIVCNDFAPWRSKSRFVVIHEAMKVRRGGWLWMESRGP
jgi:hypothetical protein